MAVSPSAPPYSNCLLAHLLGSYQCSLYYSRSATPGPEEPAPAAIPRNSGSTESGCGRGDCWTLCPPTPWARPGL